MSFLPFRKKGKNHVPAPPEKNQPLIMLVLLQILSSQAGITSNKVILYNVSEFVFPFFLEVEARLWG
jgi:hypothetical protein